MNAQPRVALLASLASLLVSPMAIPHHSHSNLDFKNIQRHTGIVKEYRWAMPHVYIKVEAPNSRGEIVEYSIEVLHPPAMLRRGWSAKSFKTGRPDHLEGAADRDPNRYFSGLSWAETADGKRLGTDREAGSRHAFQGPHGPLGSRPARQTHSIHAALRLALHGTRQGAGGPVR